MNTYRLFCRRYLAWCRLYRHILAIDPADAWARRKLTETQRALVQLRRMRIGGALTLAA